MRLYGSSCFIFLLCLNVGKINEEGTLKVKQIHCLTLTTQSIFSKNPLDFSLVVFDEIQGGELMKAIG